MWHTQTHDHTHTRMRARQMLQAISVRKMPHLCFSVSNQCAFFFAYTSKCFSIQIVNSFSGFGIIK